MTTPKYEVVPATAEHAAELAANMREADRAEIWSLASQTPEQAIAHAMLTTLQPWAALVDGKVICLFGVAKASVLGEVACPWMLSGTDLSKHKRQVMEYSKIAVTHWKQQYPHMVNVVEACYKTSVHWLRWLGFTIHAAEPMGPQKRLFHRVTIGD